jgi:hypothetical protein
MRRLALTASFFVPCLTFGQGFGHGIAKLKKTVTLERKLPAAIQLPGSTFQVKVTAVNPQYREVGEKLRQIVETEIMRFNSQLSPAESGADSVISVAVSNYNVPQPTATADPYAAPLALGGNKHNGAPQQPTAYTITGTLAVSYQAKTRAGKTLDAEPITVKFTEEVNTVSKAKEFVGKIPHPGKSKAAEEDNVRTVGDVEQILVTRVADRIAARVVNTDERVDALLARGALEEYNKYAEAGQWTDFEEKLETMPPLARADEDAYRLYNIGLANEALGYKATTPEAARRYFEKAVIDYRKASEANPHEKYFLEPVNRIEIALEHYKRLATATGTATRSKTGKK